MSRQTRWFVSLVSTPLVALITVGGLIGRPEAAEQESFKHLGVFQDVLRLVLGAYVEEANVDKVMDGAMRGLTDGLDTSSAFLLPEEVRAIDSKAPLPAGDTGLIVTRQFYLRVLGVRDGSPAARAGLQAGDFVRMIDNRPTRDMSGITGTRLLRGAPGSKVSVSIVRGNPTDPHTFELVREVPKGEAVRTTAVEGVAHVRVTTFNSTTAAALRTAFEGLAKSGTPGAVIDLRAIADGSPDDGILAARLFVKTGTLAVRAVRGAVPDKPTSEKIEAAAGDGAITTPVVLLVSNGTSNAAEVFAAALAGNKRADLVGEPTGGVAALQKLVRLPQGYGLWLTYARHMTVDGTLPIHERGLPPTVGVSTTLAGFDDVPPTTDVPLTKAIERLKTKR